MFALSAAPACRGGGGGGEADEPLPVSGPSGFSGGSADPAGAGIPTEPDPDHYVDPSTPVGTLPGVLTVQPNGEARFRIPIDVPEGRGGLQPVLSLEYASSAGTRESGKGWSVGGLSSITRCPGQIPADYQDMQPFFPGGGAAEIFRNSLEPDPYHTLCLDGRLLYPLRDAYTPGVPLLLGVVGNPRTSVTADFPNGLNNGGSFTVDLPDGTSKTYGNWDSDDRVLAGQESGNPSDFYVRRWPLIEHAERSGNTVEYRYTSTLSNTDVGTVTINHRLSQVEYIGGTVDFTYSEEPIQGDVLPRDRQVSYWRGARGEDSTYLTLIEVSGSAGGLRGEYRLDYARSEATEDLLLDAVSYCDREGVCMPATRFGYSLQEEVDTGFTPSGAGASAALRMNPAEQGTLLVADVNGDGLPDLVFSQLVSSSFYISVAYATGNGGYTDPYATDVEFFGKMRAVDEDGDGSVDIVIVRNDPVSTTASSSGVFVETIDLHDPFSASFGDVSVLAELGAALSFSGGTYDGENNCNPNPTDPPGENYCRLNALYGYFFVDLEPGGETELLGCVKAVDWWNPDFPSASTAYWHDLRAIDPSLSEGIVSPSNSFYYPTAIECATGCEDGSCEQSRAFQLLDVNGDGLQEFLIGGLGPNKGFDVPEGAPLSDESYHVFGYGFSQIVQPPAADRLPLDVFQRANEENFGGPSKDIVADVNGDGLPDVLRFEPWENGESADDASQWGDHFEQACDDTATLPPFDARLSVFVSRGDGTFSRQGSFDVFDSWSDYCDRFKKAVVADIDGDRVDEIYFPGLATNGSDVVRFYNGGAVAEWGLGPYLGGINSEVEYRARALDLTGTVNSGVLRLEEDGGSEPLLSSFARSGFVDTLQTVTDGFGAETEVEYGSLYDGQTFQGTACPSDHEALAPRRPLVAAVRRSIDSTSGIEVKAVSLHRYRGACHDAPNYNFRTFERHEVSEGFDFAGPETREITKRTVQVYDDYSTRFEREIFRAKPSEVHEYEWFPEADRYRYSVRTGTFDYGEGFFDRESAPDWLSSVPVGVLIEDDSTSTAQEFAGNCDLDPDVSSVEGWCEATGAGAGEFVSDSAVVRSNRESFGLPRLIERRWGDQCSVETIGYEYREHTALRRNTVMQLGKIVSTGGGDGALGGVCDVSSPDVGTQRAELVVERDPATWRVEEVVSQPGDPEQELRADLVYENGQLTQVTQTAPASAGAQGALTNIREWNWTYGTDDLFIQTATNPEGHLSELRWHPDLGVPFLSADPNGVVQETRLDGFGRPLSEAVRLGSVGDYAGPPSTTVYAGVDPVAAANGDPTPLRVVATDPAGRESMTEFTRHRNVARSEWDVSESLRVFSRTLRVRGTNGLSVLQSPPTAVGEDHGASSEVFYDPNGRMLETTPAAADLGPTVYRYAGRTTTVEAPDGGITTVISSLGGLPEQSIDAEGTLSCYYYGGGGALRDVVVNPDAGGCYGSTPSDGPRRVSSHFEYDERGNLTLRDLPGKSAENVSTNAFGDVWRIQDAAGDTRFMRDQLGRVVRRDDVGEGVSTFDWDSDADCAWADGLLRRATSGDGVEQLFDYDVFGRPSARTMSVDDRTFRTSLHYNEIGQLGEIRAPLDGPRARYEYDGVGSLSTISANGTALWSVQDRDVTGVASDVAYGNGVQSTRTIVEGLLREAHVLAPNATAPYPGATESMLEIDSLELEYDAAGRIAMRGIPHLQLREDFEHDLLGRLESWTTEREGATEEEVTQTYWETGAIRNRSDIGNYVYIGMNVRAAGGVSYEHDADGRQDTRGSYSFEWTRRSRLRFASDGANSSAYTYDAFDSRVKRVETTSGVSTTTYYDELLEVEVGAGAETHTFFVPGEEGRIAAMKRTGGEAAYDTLYMHSNNQGSASIVTDEDGLVVERRDYDPFGRRRAVTWAAGDPVFAGDAGLDIGYTGHREEEAHGLIDMRGRHYDPHLARFASADPVLAAPFSSQGHDPFAYVFNSPLSFTDPSGFIAEGGADYDDDDGGGYDGIADWQDYSSADLDRPDGSGFEDERVFGSPLPDDYSRPSNQPGADELDEGDFEPDVDGPGGEPWYEGAARVVIPLAAGGALAGVAVLLGGGAAAAGAGAAGGTGALAAADGAGLLSRIGAEGARALLEEVPIPSVGNGGPDVRPARFLRAIRPGEQVLDIIEEVARVTESTGLEHALVSLRDGSRALYQGGPDGMSFRNVNLRRILGHSHPLGSLPGPSVEDFEALGTIFNTDVSQVSSYLLELQANGPPVLSRFWGFGDVE